MVSHEPSSSVYSTAQLDLKSRAIRLIEVLPGDRASVISCKFRTQLLHNPSAYTALSYTWGDSSNMKEILIEESTFEVRDNLWQFLYQMREQSSGYPECFWIDAICIDQGSVQERNHQVALMKHIYSKAARVAVWLGSAGANSDLAIERIRTSPTDLHRSSRPIWTHEEGLSILELCGRPYWQQIWIVQEFILAPNITLYCGQKQFTWHSLSSWFTLLEDERICIESVEYPYTKEIRSSFAAYMVQQRLQKTTNGLFPLYDLLQTYKHLKSADVRDKVYGLLGLNQDDVLDELQLAADYSKSAEMIYNEMRDTCRYLRYWRPSDRLQFLTALQQTLELPDCMVREAVARYAYYFHQ